MQETFFLSAIFLLLALAGVEPGQGHAPKTCTTGFIAELVADC